MYGERRKKQSGTNVETFPLQVLTSTFPLEFVSVTVHFYSRIKTIAEKQYELTVMLEKKAEKDTIEGCQIRFRSTTSCAYFRLHFRFQ